MTHGYVLTAGQVMKLFMIDISIVRIAVKRLNGVSEMARFEIEYAQFTKVVIEAENEEEANDLAAIMDGEEIAEHDTHEYDIWNVRKID